MRKATNRKMPVHLNLNVRGLGASATLAVNERCDEPRLQGRTVYKLGLGQSPFPVPAPVVEALQANTFQKNYLPVKGLAELRTAVASCHCRRQEVECIAMARLVPADKPLDEEFLRNCRSGVPRAIDLIRDWFNE